MLMSSRPKSRRATMTPARYDARRRGRPSKFRNEFVDIAAELCQQGATDAELAKAFDCDITTLNRWKAAHPDFRQSLTMAKNVADDRVERSLFQRACGYSIDTVKVMQHDGCPVVVDVVEHVPADVAAGFIWLKNRRPHSWRDRREVLAAHVHRIEQSLTDDELLAIASGRSEASEVLEAVAEPVPLIGSSGERSDRGGER
jgi:transposase-like protein